MAHPKLPEAVIALQAKRERRMHHFLWHQTRNMWLLWDESTREELRSLGWEPPRPARATGANGRPAPILDNDSGEDFLYMHRKMIHATNAKLREVGSPDYPRVEGWKQLPRVGDEDFPVPAPWDTGDQGFNRFLVQVKSDAYLGDVLDPWADTYTSAESLKRMTLGELGARIEFTIHNMMHMRWCAEIAEFRPSPPPGTPSTIEPRWDAPSYRWLGDTYSSHVNPTFWKLHGWCDDRIDDWKRAHGLTGDIVWKGTWLGDMPGHPNPESLHSMLTATEHDHTHDHGSNMEAAVRVVMKSGRFCQFYDELDLSGLNPPEA